MAIIKAEDINNEGETVEVPIFIDYPCPPPGQDLNYFMLICLLFSMFCNFIQYITK